MGELRWLVTRLSNQPNQNPEVPHVKSNIHDIQQQGERLCTSQTELDISHSSQWQVEAVTTEALEPVQDVDIQALTTQHDQLCTLKEENKKIEARSLPGKEAVC